MRIWVVSFGVCLCLFAMCIQDVLAFRCNKYEYVELKDMEKDYLNRVICELEISIEYNLKKIKIKPINMEEHKDFDNCIEQKGKAYRVFKTKFNEEPIECNKLLKGKGGDHD